MTNATLTITLPERTWIHEISTAHPDASFRVLAALPNDDTGIGLVRITAPDIDPILEAMATNDGITSATAIRRRENRALVEFETTQPELLHSARQAGVPIEPPVDVQNGRASLSVTASHARLSQFGSLLEAFGMDVTVERVESADEPDRLLTDRQRELLLAAVAHGYYDTPRGCSMTDLADSLGIAKSTCSETLHRAEERLVKRFVEGLPESDRDEPVPASG